MKSSTSKFIRRLLAALLGAALLAALLPSLVPSETAEADDRLHIVTTIFPEYDWVRCILGDEAENAELTCLLGNGTDQHSYQPTAADIMTIASCDLFIYVGGASDRWVGDVLKQTESSGRKVICLMDELKEKVKEEELLEGMQEEEEEEEETEYDEHVFLSLKNAAVICGTIADTLGSLSPDSAGTFRANADAYTEKLLALDKEYEAAVETSPSKTLLFGDRFPFRYMADDYSLTCYAAFPGCSSETEASFETILFLASKMDELNLPCILTIENSDQKIAETIVQNTKSKDRKILVLNSMQSVRADQSGDISYLGIMEDNLQVLKEALA